MQQTSLVSVQVVDCGRWTAIWDVLVAGEVVGRVWAVKRSGWWIVDRHELAGIDLERKATMHLWKLVDCVCREVESEYDPAF